MKVIEITGTAYPGAHELPNRGGRPVAKHQKSAGGNSGSANKKLSLPLSPAQKKSAQDATEAGKMVLVITGGKRRMIRVSEYEAGRY